VNNEALVQDAINARVWWFANVPVSTENLRLVGTIGADSEFIVNYNMEPLTGRLTIDPALPIYDSVAAWYWHYTGLNDGVDLLVVNYKVEFPKLVSEVDIWAQPHYQKHNNYPHSVSFSLVLSSESMRNLLTESMFYGYYFILLDKNIGYQYGLRAFEGPLWSDEQGSVKKGLTPLLPIEIFVQEFGMYKRELSGAITSASDGGAGTTILAMASHGLNSGDWIIVTDTVVYDGTWQVTVVDAHNVKITVAFAGDATGNWVRHEEIDWGHWER